ncbi:ABC transporter permease [Pseudomonas fluorescens]|uniref:Inner membrane ABC transporter permease protein YejE n=1 Tax=Pseudomonas fluorescens TaxID=294 RepID=A0A5E7DVF2_PSEFL|nr:ABC transporter permease [Pseudomonas fluorescens]VVO12474.1 Inner membrane ABC transporter permease protein YejE [Pseudomonas fluorescens]
MTSQTVAPPSIWRRLWQRPPHLRTPVLETDLPPAPVLTPGRRVWLRFKQHRLGYWSLIIFTSLYLLSLAGELISNDKPLLIYFQQHWYFPLFEDYPEGVFGGQLPIHADYNDPFIREQLAQPGNFALYPLNPYYYDTLNYFSNAVHYPGPPTAENLLGTDIAGYDIIARLLYGFRVSVTFGLALTFIGTVLGVLIGAIQGYFAGKIDLFTQRLIEVWGSLPELYLLIIFASIFEPSLILLCVLLSLFGWIYLSDFVRAEFLRNRQLEYVKAARAMGLSHAQIIWRHILPNSLTPVITFLPFRMSAAIMALASLDFLGLGVEAPAPSLGQLLLQGKENLDAWWIAVSAFGVLMITLLLLTFMGEALRNALDTRIADKPLAENL